MSTLFWISYALLWLVTILSLVGVFGLYYYFGQTYLNSRQGRFEDQGPELQRKLAAAERYTHSGEEHSLADGTPKVALFFSSDCTLCEDIRLELSAGNSADFPAVVFVDGDSSHCDEWKTVAPSSWRVVQDKHGKIAVRHKIHSTPYCFGLGADDTVRIKGNVNTLVGIAGAYSRAAATDASNMREDEVTA